MTVEEVNAGLVKSLVLVRTCRRAQGQPLEIAEQIGRCNGRGSRPRLRTEREPVRIIGPWAPHYVCRGLEQSYEILRIAPSVDVREPSDDARRREKAPRVAVKPGVARVGKVTVDDLPVFVMSQVGHLDVWNDIRRSQDHDVVGAVPVCRVCRWRPCCREYLRAHAPACLRSRAWPCRPDRRASFQSHVSRQTQSSPRRRPRCAGVLAPWYFFNSAERLDTMILSRWTISRLLVCLWCQRQRQQVADNRRLAVRRATNHFDQILAGLSEPRFPHAVTFAAAIEKRVAAPSRDAQPQAPRSGSP